MLPPAPPRVLLWTSVRIYRDGLLAALSTDTRIHSVVAVADLDTCLEATSELRPSVLIVDAGCDGARDAARAAAAAGTGVIALGIAESQDDVVAFAEAGALAYVTRDQPLEDLLGTIFTVAGGEPACSPRITRLLLRHVAAADARRERDARRTVHLTRREAQILDLVATGLTNKQIGLELSIELATVKNHVHHILEKLGVSSRARAVAMTRGRDARVAIMLS